MRRVPGLLTLRWITLLALLALTGCQAGYYTQLLRGQYDLMKRRQPIEQLLAAPDTDAALKQRLALVLEARRFASRELGLPDNRSYTLYADVGRPYVVWNVYAAPEFSLAPRQWCYPLMGCMAYRGYYAQAGAQAQADALRREGLDVTVGGVTAYSTLGWFDDPVLNTLLRYPDEQVAGTVIHELAHQKLYVKGDTAFNESFATFVEQEGLRRFLETRPAMAEASRLRLERDRRFVALLAGARERLEKLYARPLAPERMREEKRAEIERLRADYRAQRAAFGNDPGYDVWFAGEINNARLLPFGLYYRWVDAFAALFRAQGAQWPAFYAAAAAVGALPDQAREAKLKTLNAS